MGLVRLGTKVNRKWGVPREDQQREREKTQRLLKQISSYGVTESAYISANKKTGGLNCNGDRVRDTRGEFVGEFTIRGSSFRSAAPVRGILSNKEMKATAQSKCSINQRKSRCSETDGVLSAHLRQQISLSPSWASLREVCARLETPVKRISHVLPEVHLDCLPANNSSHWRATWSASVNKWFISVLRKYCMKKTFYSVSNSNLVRSGSTVSIL